MHKPNLIVLILLIFTFVLLIVSYSSYWYMQWDDDATSYLKHDQIKSETSSSTRTRTWKQVFGSEDVVKNTLSIYRASLAFSVLAWVVNILCIVFISLSLTNILAKMPIPLLPTITKFLPGVVFLFCALAMFIFSGLPNAMLRDCKKRFDDSSFNTDPCDLKQYKSLIGREDGDDGTRFSGIQGFACVVISSIFTLIATIISVLFGQYGTPAAA